VSLYHHQMAEDTAERKSGRGDVFVYAQLGLIALVVLGPRSFGDSEPWPGIWGQAAWAAGQALLLAGAAFALAGFIYLGSNLSPWPRPREGSRLVQTGVYRLVRHPLYTGLIFSALGWALRVNGPLTLLYAICLAALLDRKARYEEHWLRRKFGSYADYQRKVKRFVPFIY